MEDALPGSRYVETNNKEPALPTLSNVVNFLTLFDKSDGGKAPVAAQKLPAPAAKRPKNNRGAATSAPAPVMTVVADRKHKRTMHGMTTDGVYTHPKYVTADAKRRACGQLDHIAWDRKCPQFLAQNTPFKAAVGQAVEEDSA
ncbi:hypothetical protein PR003_g6507 [Phytophthora rubi]|uniref:Uncharacterized protein n=1 Tax=Phytophthora rubi TaxID=129364 RepID=A0A6A3NAA9_9STRA|nr:hypothetical protein PR001_g6206 [Phytophthora rubi]KAE9348281.1 hypothetical protein PR003_g6507 [Phytophthora rubi]